jgi:NADH-ubiquinone oxidoreductase chain 5
MAAPTPVSALVHSSTLVTAGVYLLFRFYTTILRRGYGEFVALVGTLTITIAGLRAFFETDIKKIVALSTLSQLGLIIAALGVGSYLIAFFHLLTHAYFKALLFISVGNIIHSSNNFQDLRKVSLKRKNFISTGRFALISNLSLCGLPFLAGFYSKDLLLERRARGRMSFYLYFIFYFATGLTIAYSVRFIFYTHLRNRAQSSLTNTQDRGIEIANSIKGLLILAVLG